jgi:hypothetical protein
VLACFLLVCRLESIDWCAARLPRRGDFLSMTEVMNVTPIILVLIILLFGFDSSVSSALSAVRRFSKFSEISVFEKLRNK